MDLAASLAESAVSRQFSDLATTTVDATVDALIDSLACALAGANAEGLAPARQALTAWGPGPCDVWGGFGQAPAPVAAFLNAVSLHALDYDDTDDQVPLHACGMVLPGLMADLQTLDPERDGRHFLTSLAVGIDGAMRVGRSGGPKGSRGWNYSVISGSMGAMLALAHQRGFDARRAVDGLGHQLTQTAGSLQSIIDGSLAKRFQPAMMVKNVLYSTALTAAGIDGPRQVFDGKAGFIQLYQDGSFQREKVLIDLDHCALVDDLSLKPYPACRFTHAPIDLALQLHTQGLRPEDIEHIRIWVSGQAVNMVGRHYVPQNASIVDAQFSIAYTVAVGIARGAVRIADFTEACIHEERVGQFAERQITIEADPDVPFLGMVPVRMDVALHNGQTLTLSTHTVSGAPEQRMSASQLRDKVADCLQHGRARIGADALIDTVMALREGAPVSQLFTLLA